jgi:threonine dehydrogenase-like Zn-dependent dehydrogenase
MRAAVLREGRMVYRDDVPEPVPGPGQVLVGVKSCGICGSDLHFAAHSDEVVSLTGQMVGDDSLGVMSLDMNRDVFMGHEFSAEVLEAGPDTETFPAGTPVTSIPLLISGERVEPTSTATRRSVATPSGCCFQHRCCCAFPTAWTISTLL